MELFKLERLERVKTERNTGRANEFKAANTKLKC